MILSELLKGGTRESLFINWISVITLVPMTIKIETHGEGCISRGHVRIPTGRRNSVPQMFGTPNCTHTVRPRPTLDKRSKNVAFVHSQSSADSSRIT